MVADAEPEVAVGRLVARHRVVGHGHAGHLDDARFDGVDQGEIRSHPGEKPPLPIARPTEKEGRGREVVHGLDADLALDRLQAGDPDLGGLVPLVGLLALLAIELDILGDLAAPVAVVGLVVEHHDVPLGAQFPADAAHYLVGRLREGARVAAGEDLLGEPGCLHALARQEAVIVGDDDLGVTQLRQLVGGHQVALAVVVARVLWEQHAEPVADRDARGHHEEGVGESVVLRVGQLVERVPGDEHGHDDRLAAAGGHFEGDAEQERVVLVVGLPDRAFDPGVAASLGGLREVDGRLQGLDLAEEQLAVAVRVGPILQEARSCPGDAGVVPLAPESHSATDLIDELVLLDPVLGPFGVEHELGLGALLLARLGDGDEVGTDPSGLDDLAGDPLVGEAEVPRRLHVG